MHDTLIGQLGKWFTDQYHTFKSFNPELKTLDDPTLYNDVYGCS